MLSVCRSRLYYKSIINNDSEIANWINEIYLASDCRYGYRKIAAEFKCKGLEVNKKRIFRVMQSMGLQGLYPRRKCNTSIKNKEHKIYPYLLKDLLINKANHVWATDITYISIEGKFMYFVAIIDLYSRYIIAYELSPYLEAGFCVYALKMALKMGKPEIFNSDQGAQFTSSDFIKELSSLDIKISMDHKGRCFDNIYSERFWRTLKQEAIYYYKPSSIRELEVVLKDFVSWYNYKRRHQSLDYQIPAELYYK